MAVVSSNYDHDPSSFVQALVYPLELELRQTDAALALRFSAPVLVLHPQIADDAGVPCIRHAILEADVNFKGVHKQLIQLPMHGLNK